MLDLSIIPMSAFFSRETAAFDRREYGNEGQRNVVFDNLNEREAAQRRTEMGKSFLAESLESRSVQWSVGGKIRVGTKAISKKASAVPGAKALYEKALKGLISFREAEKEIYKAHNVSNPFYPRNTEEFHAHPWDMNTGGMATSRRILELYGETRPGSHEVKLYRFPVVFPDVRDHDLDSLVGGGLAVRGGGADTVRYSSRYEPDGSRVCTHLPEIVRTAETKRKVIQHVRRKPVVRGACVPEECAEFAFGMCKFSGTLRFFIPGIAGAGVFELHTGSTEAMTQIYLRLGQAMQTCQGRLPNFTPDGRPVFWISKVRAERTYHDEEGRMQRGEQWVPQLDMEIELPKVMWLKQQEAMMLPAPTGTAVPSAWVDDNAQDLAVGITLGKNENGSVATEGVPTPAVSNLVVEAPNVTEDALSDMKAHALAHDYPEALGHWAQRRFGDDWMAQMTEVAIAWSEMKKRFEGRTGSWLVLLNKISQLNLDQEMVVKYLRVKIGPLKNGEILPQYLGELDDLCSDGASVATEIMAATLDSAAG